MIKELYNLTSSNILLNALPMMFLLFFNNVCAQDFEITKHILGEDLDFPSGITFADDGAEKLWIHYRTTENGATIDKLVKFEANEWSPENFDICASCIRDFKTGPDGKLWIAADTNGIYKREADQWTKVLDHEALGIAWQENGDLIIINKEGAFHYDGNEVTPGNQDGMPAMTEEPHDVVIDRTGDLYLILSSKLFLYNIAAGWKELNELSAPMNIEVDSENKVWVTDNFGEIGYYQEGIYIGGQYNYFGADGFDIDHSDVLWYAAEELVRNQNGVETSISAEDLIDDGIFINSVYVDQNNLVWVASNFKSAIASVKYLGDPTSIKEYDKKSNVVLSPNPVFNQSNINITLPESADVKIIIYNIAGKTISSIERQLSSGHHVVPLEVSALRSGIYLVNISYGKTSKTLKMVKK